MSCVLPYAYINAKYKQVCGGSGFIPPLLGCRPACSYTSTVWSCVLLPARAQKAMLTAKASQPAASAAARRLRLLCVVAVGLVLCSSLARPPQQQTTEEQAPSLSAADSSVPASLMPPPSASPMPPPSASPSQHPSPLPPSSIATSVSPWLLLAAACVVIALASCPMHALLRFFTCCSSDPADSMEVGKMSAQLTHWRENCCLAPADGSSAGRHCCPSVGRALVELRARSPAWLQVTLRPRPSHAYAHVCAGAGAGGHA